MVPLALALIIGGNSAMHYPSIVSSKSGFLWQRRVPPGYSEQLQQTQCKRQLSRNGTLGIFQLDGWHLFDWNSMINQIC